MTGLGQHREPDGAAAAILEHAVAVAIGQAGRRQELARLGRVDGYAGADADRHRVFPGLTGPKIGTAAPRYTELAIAWRSTA